MASIGDEIDAHLLGSFHIGQVREQQQRRPRRAIINTVGVHMKRKEMPTYRGGLKFDDL